MMIVKTSMVHDVRRTFQCDLNLSVPDFLRVVHANGDNIVEISSCVPRSSLWATSGSKSRHSY